MDDTLLCPADAEGQDGTMVADCQDRDISPTRKRGALWRPTLARASGSCLLFCPLSLSPPKGAQLTRSPHLGYSSLIVRAYPKKWTVPLRIEGQSPFSDRLLGLAIPSPLVTSPHPGTKSRRFR